MKIVVVGVGFRAELEIPDGAHLQMVDSDGVTAVEMDADDAREVLVSSLQRECMREKSTPSVLEQCLAAGAVVMESGIMSNFCVHCGAVTPTEPGKANWRAAHRKTGHMMFLPDEPTGGAV